MRTLLSLASILFAVNLFAQVNSTTAGEITIKQDARIDALVAKHIETNETAKGTIPGWRIQIYNSSGTNSRAEAQNERKKFLAKYPEIGAYLIYQPPFFKIRVGDFRTKDEAYALYKKLLVDFPVSYLITDNINFPKLQEEETEIERLLDGITE